MSAKVNKRIGVPVFIASDIVFDEVTHRQAAELKGRYPEARSALLPLLHLVQSVEGCVTQAGIEFCAEQLDLTAAEVSAVATFYTMYKRTPCGQHLVSVCTNTLCAALGGDAIYRTLSDHLGVGHEETAGVPGEVGSITLESAECLAACDNGPVLTVNYEFYDDQTPDDALDLVMQLQAGNKPDPTRGAPLTDFRAASLEIAGITPEPAEQQRLVGGFSQAETTLRGNRIAEQTGSQAPAMPESYDLPEKK